MADLTDISQLHRWDREDLDEGLHSAATAHADLLDKPLFNIFINRHAGSRILWRMVADSEGGAFPPLRTRALSAAALARSFRVSRIHIRRLLDEAERQDFLRREGDGCIRFSEAGRAAIGDHYAVQFASLLRAASRTVGALAQPTPEPVGASA